MNFNWNGANDQTKTCYVFEFLIIDEGSARIHLNTALYVVMLRVYTRGEREHTAQVAMCDRLDRDARVLFNVNTDAESEVRERENVRSESLSTSVAVYEFV